MISVRTRTSSPPFSWEIYEIDEQGKPSGVPLAEAQEFYATEAAAKAAGDRALRAFVRTGDGSIFAVNSAIATMSGDPGTGKTNLTTVSRRG
jgi:hypothetical protein